MEVEAFNESGAPLSHATNAKIAKIIHEGIKLCCPLCRAEVRLFSINFTEKIFMCENFKCVYPLGYEDVIYVKVKKNQRDCSEDLSVKDKMNTALEMLEIENIINKLNTCNKELKNSEKILKKVEETIEKLKVEIAEEEHKNCLWNEKMIRNLMQS